MNKVTTESACDPNDPCCGETDVTGAPHCCNNPDPCCEEPKSCKCNPCNSPTCDEYDMCTCAGICDPCDIDPLSCECNKCNPSCPGYSDSCECNSCNKPSCPGYSACACDPGSCACDSCIRSSCPGYNACACNPASCAAPVVYPVVWSVEVQYDRFPRETSWAIIDPKQRNKRKRNIAAVSKKKARRFRKNHKLVVKNLNFVPGKSYRIIMKDLLDGFCCSFGKGYIRIIASRNGRVVWSRKVDGKFKFLRSSKKTNIIIPKPVPA